MHYAPQPTLSCPPLTQEEPPSFIRRCGHRNLMGRAPSEKLGRPVSWSTASQARLANLLEVTHGVVSYEAWPLKVALRVGWSRPTEYWPVMGFTGADGEQVAIDVVHNEDMDDRANMGFDQLLAEALDLRGVRLVVFREIHLATDRKVALARQLTRYVGTSVPLDDAADLRGLIRGHGGRMTLEQIRMSSQDGALRMAQACVLGMRRRLCLGLDATSVERSTVSLCGIEGDVA